MNEIREPVSKPAHLSIADFVVWFVAIASVFPKLGVKA